MREKLIHLIISKQSASRESTRTLVCLAPSFTSVFFRVNTCGRAEVAKGCM